MHANFYLKTATVTINCSVPVYIDMTANTSHSSTVNLRIAYLITSLATLSKAFFPNLQSQNRASFL